MCVVCHIAGGVRVCVAGAPCVCGCVLCWRGYPAGVAGVCGWHQESYQEQWWRSSQPSYSFSLMCRVLGRSMRLWNFTT